jgi:hypothetical protein
MAEDKSVTKAYGSARLARQEAQDRLKGVGGHGGLEAAWIHAQEMYAKRNDPGVFTKQVIEEYNRTKVAYEEVSKKYQDALAIETKYKEQLDSAAKDAGKKQTVKDAADKLAKAKAEKAKADSLIPSRGKAQSDAAAAAVTKAQAAYDKANADAKTTATSAAAADGTTLANDKYSEYTLNNDGTVTNKDGKQGIFVDEKDASGNITPKFYTSYASARDAFLKGYASEGQINTLQQQLLSSGYIKKDSIVNGTWVKGLDEALAAHSFKAVSDVKYNGVKDPMDFNAFLSIKKTGTGTGGPKTYRVITTRGEAKTLLDGYLMDLTGSASTEQEADSFYKQLHDAENKAVQTVNNGTTTGSTLGDADRIMIAAKVARNRLRNSDVDTILKSGTGSQVAMDIAKLQKTAANYGVNMTAAEALQHVAAGVGQKDYLAKQEERLKLISKQLHPNLAAHIDAGGTVADIADQYAYTKSRKLGVAVPVSTVDKDVMDAVTKGISIADFNTQLQSRPEWRKTTEAHDAVNSFINNISQMWGLG